MKHKPSYTISIYDMHEFITSLEKRVEACTTLFTLGVEQGRLDMVSHLISREALNRISKRILERMREVM